MKAKVNHLGHHFILMNLINHILWYRQKMNELILLSIFAIWNTNLPAEMHALFFSNYAKLQNEDFLIELGNHYSSHPLGKP